MILERICVGELEVNCYVLAQDKGLGALIIDPGADYFKIKKTIDKFQLTPRLIINTHGHFDHIGCDNDFGVPVYAHKQDLPMLVDSGRNFSVLSGSPVEVRGRINLLSDGQAIRRDGLELEVIHTPGHSPGGICLLLKKPETGILFSGDTLFRYGVGRTDLSGADQEALFNSIKNRLLKLPDDTVVYPGHGGASTIGEERRRNPFLV